MERVLVSPETVLILGSKAKDEKDPLWSGLDLSRAQPAMQSTLMLMVCGSSDAPVDMHLRVPWCHPNDQSGSPDDFDCIYRVRPRMRAGGRWKGKKVKAIHGFECWDGKWWIAFEYLSSALAAPQIKNQSMGNL